MNSIGFSDLSNPRLKHNIITKLTIKKKNIKSFEELNLEKFPNLVHLICSDTCISSFKGFPQFKKLKTLNISGNSFTTLDDIPFLEELIELDCSKNNIHSTKGLSNLPSLNSFKASSNKISDISNINSFVNEIKIDYNELTSLKSISHLINLKYLSVSYNKLENLNYFPSCSYLENFYLNNNSINSLEGIPIDNQIKTLIFHNNLITSLDHIKDMKSIRILGFAGNLITNIDPLINLTQIKEIIISQNGISSLNGLKNMIYLKSLVMNGTNIKSLEEIIHLKQITEINCNCIPNFSFRKIEQLINLKSLFAKNCEITSIEDISKSTSIMNLELGKNKLKDIRAIHSMKSLRKLSVEFNELVTLEGIQELKNLVELNIENNYIPGIPEIINLKNLKKFNFNNNSIIKHTPEIKKALRKIRKNNSETFQEINTEPDIIRHYMTNSEITFLEKILLKWQDSNSFMDKHYLISQIFNLNPDKFKFVKFMQFFNSTFIITEFNCTSSLIFKSIYEELSTDYNIICRDCIVIEFINSLEESDKILSIIKKLINTINNYSNCLFFNFEGSKNKRKDDEMIENSSNDDLFILDYIPFTKKARIN